MARISAEDQTGERSNNNRPLPKRPRISDPPSTSNPPNPAAAYSAAAERLSLFDSPGAAAIFERRRIVYIDERPSDESATPLTSFADSESESGGEEVQNRGNEEEEEAVVIGSGSRRGESGSSSGAVAVILTDTDVLDCPICLDSLCAPVYQCENGHILCASCCTKMRNKCGNCSLPIGYNRCRAIEKVLESVRIACRNMPLGCTETPHYSKKLAHEKTCNYAPCSCPLIGCEYVGMSKSLYAHFAEIHSQSRKHFNFNRDFAISLDNHQKYVFLQERSQNVLFVLNRSTESVGSFVSVVCVAPTAENKLYSYEITANVGESSVKMKTYTECMPKWTAQTPAKISLHVPRPFVGETGQVHLGLAIWRDSVDTR